MKSTLLKAASNGERFELTSPTAMPNACGFLWNKKMMIQINCRGYATAQFMQPEPAKYTHAPNLEAKTFMQPEQPYYAHHPGRFFYIKDEDTGEIFSAPFAPTKVVPEQYTFSAGKYDVQWEVKHLGIQVNLTLTLPTEDIVEQWECHVKNIGTNTRNLSIYPYFPFGYMSWMNQSGEYRKDLGGIVANCITPYQKYTDYFKNINFKDKTYFLHEQTPTSYDVNQSVFEGETGLHNPQGIQQTQLSNSDAIYETPAAVLQYRTNLGPQQQKTYRFLLGPAKTEEEIAHIRNKYFGEGFEAAKAAYKEYVDAGKGVIQVNTPDEHFNNHTNHWLARQVYYHGDVNRLTTDPQTRNYLQDNMGMSYIAPQTTRAAFLHALSQQEASGAMPDGIILVEGTELKYINQIPHTDHCIWLPVCLQAYLDETNDYALLNEAVTDETGVTLSVFERISRAMDWLIKSTDERGLSYIAQGDWCDPMNMVGYKGNGVSGWLSVATAYALKLWARVCHQSNQPALAAHFSKAQETINHSVNTHLWDEHWYARGITDDNVTFGIKADAEGRIFLNPQSWAILADTCTPEKTAGMLKAIEEQLETPYGPMMFAPAYTSMREDVGRVTQKFPGSAENGSVYNHASVFYIYSLYTIGEGEKAYDLLRKMLTGPSEQDYLTRGQMPIYIPNYYRGAYYQHPRTAGRSSQLFNTGTVAWVYRCLIEGLFGLKGSPEGLNIQPQLPKAWHTASATRVFRGATFDVTYKRGNTNTTQVLIDGTPLTSTYENTPCITQIIKGQHYKVEVLLPEAGNE